MKYFVFSIDDGTTYDIPITALLEKYHMKGTFNLNSGLQNFVWYYNDSIPIRRLDLRKFKYIYEQHEIATHTSSHPYLDSCSDEQVMEEVSRDVEELQNIFEREVVSFATPFETCGEREVNLIKNCAKIKNIRLSQVDESFDFPLDPYFIKVTALDVDRALELFDSFVEKEDALFVYAGHSYDFFVNDSLDRFEILLKKISERNDIKVVTMKELIEEIYKED